MNKTSELLTSSTPPSHVTKFVEGISHVMKYARARNTAVTTVRLGLPTLHIKAVNFLSEEFESLTETESHFVRDEMLRH